MDAFLSEMYTKAIALIIDEFSSHDPKIGSDFFLVDSMNVDEVAFHKSIYYSRNKLWVKKINAIAGGNEVPFYPLGAGHFFSTKHSRGLISLLRDEGYSITLVKDYQHLRFILSRHGLM